MNVIHFIIIMPVLLVSGGGDEELRSQSQDLKSEGAQNQGKKDPLQQTEGHQVTSDSHVLSRPSAGSLGDSEQELGDELSSTGSSGHSSTLQGLPVSSSQHGPTGILGSVSGLPDMESTILQGTGMGVVPIQLTQEGLKLLENQTGLTEEERERLKGQEEIPEDQLELIAIKLINEQIANDRSLIGAGRGQVTSGLPLTRDHTQRIELKIPSYITGPIRKQLENFSHMPSIDGFVPGTLGTGSLRGLQETQDGLNAVGSGAHSTTLGRGRPVTTTQNGGTRRPGEDSQASSLGRGTTSQTNDPRRQGTSVTSSRPSQHVQKKEIEDAVGRDIRYSLTKDSSYIYPEFEQIQEKNRDNVGDYLIGAIERLVEILLHSKYSILLDHGTIISDIQNKGESYHQEGLKMLNGIKFKSKNEAHDLIKGFNGVYYRIFMRLNDLKKCNNPSEAMKIVGSLNVIPQSVAMELERIFPSTIEGRKIVELDPQRSDNYVAAGYKISLLVTKDILRKIHQAWFWFAKLSNYIYNEDVVRMAKTRLIKVPHPKNLEGSALPKPKEVKIIGNNENGEKGSIGIGNTTGNETGLFRFGEILDEMGMMNLESFVRAQEAGIIREDGSFIDSQRTEEEDKKEDEKKVSIFGAIKRKIHEMTASSFETMSIIVAAGIMLSLMVL